MLAAEGRVVMVSGASRGIGRAVVDRLLASGFAVSAGLRKPEKLAGTDRLMTHRYDAEDGRLGRCLGWRDGRALRHVDAIVNAAGLNPRVRVQDEGEDLLDEMWRVNVKGPLRVIRAALPHLAKCGHGRVVNLGSLAGKRVGSNVGYAMTKFAVVRLHHGVRREGRDAGIRATVILPRLRRHRHDRQRNRDPAARHDQPGDLAELVETVLRLPNNASVRNCWCTASSNRCSDAPQGREGGNRGSCRQDRSSNQEARREVAAISKFTPATLHEAQGRSGALTSRHQAESIRACAPAGRHSRRAVIPADNLMLIPRRSSLAQPGDMLVVSAGDNCGTGWLWRSAGDGLQGQGHRRPGHR